VADLDEEALDTLKTERSSARTPEAPELPPSLIRVISAEDLSEPPARHWLEGCEEVRIFRGRRGATREEPHSLTIILEDRYASTRHVLLRRVPEGFLVSDEGSTNGTYVNGEKLAAGEERLIQTALLEVGHTFFYLRTPVRGARDAPTDERTGDSLTFNPEFALTLAAAGRLARRAHDLLLTGESGVGKEVIARWLHQVSERRGGLVAVNCAALPEQLLEDELFGHLKGAFSGALSDRSGLIRAAHEGTLLLDEIGDMPLPLQAKLLRVIEDRRVRPLGGEREIPVDVLVIAATNRELNAMAVEGRFRQDLLARLGLLRLSVPPLRARREDLGLLIRQIVREVPEGLDRISFELEALRMMLLHDWPLNVRELRRVLLAAVDLARGEEGEPIVVGPQHLPLTVNELPSPQRSSVGPLSADDQQLRARILEALAEHHGNVAAVARALGKPRTRVQRLMARLGIQRRDC
jgi:transcriptional regulator with PAS, ATPase and Fis domain